jgi:hypothetical protein
MDEVDIEEEGREPGPPIGYRGGARPAWNSRTSSIIAPGCQSRNGAIVSTPGNTSAPAARTAVDRFSRPSRAPARSQARNTSANGARSSFVESARPRASAPRTGRSPASAGQPDETGEEQDVGLAVPQEREGDSGPARSRSGTSR